MTLAAFPAGSTRGFSEQPQSFVAELQRLSGGQISVTTLAGADAIQPSELNVNMQTSVDLFAWNGPLRRSGINSAYIVFSGLPFGLAPADHVAWMRNGGADLLEQLHWRDNLDYRVVPCGIGTGAGAWHRREITTPNDLRGLRVRSYGIVTTILGRLGAVSVTADNTRLRTVFTSNTLDAFYEISALSSIFIARPAQGTTPLVYHFPGWHQPSYLLVVQVPAQVWIAMGEPMQRLVDEACRVNLDRWVTESASVQRQVAEQARTNGLTVRPYTGPVLEALRRATEEVIADEARNPEFKAALDSYRRFRR